MTLNIGIPQAIMLALYFMSLGDERYPTDEYDKEFDFLGWHFNFWGDDCGRTPKYGATMSCNKEHWACTYDYGFGAGFDDIH